jgi:hypothetical protein
MAIISLITEYDSGQPVTVKANQVDTSKGSISVAVRLLRDGVELTADLPIILRTEELSGTAKTKLETAIEDALRYRGWIA